MQKTFFLFIQLITIATYAQNSQNVFSYLEGSWAGAVQEYPIKINFIKNVNNNEYLIEIYNLSNEKLSIISKDISENKVGEIVIKIKKATTSISNQCNYSYGQIRIFCKNENQIIFNLDSIGPNCWISDDQSINITGLKEILMLKKT